MNATAPTPPAPPAPPAPPRPQRQLRRSTSDRMLGGVAGGIAQTYNLDPTLVRLAFVVGAIFGIGVLLYLGAWIVIPPDDPTADTQPFPFSPVTRLPQIVGIILIGIGVLIAADRIVPGGGRGFFGIGWPVALILLGSAILVRRARDLRDQDDDDLDGTDPGGTPPRADTLPPAGAADAPAGATAGTVTDVTDVTDVTYVTDSTDAAEAPTEPIGGPGGPPGDTTSAWMQRTPWPAPPRRPDVARPRRPRSFLTPLTISVLAVYAGVVALLSATNALDVNVEAALAIALGIVGVSLLISTVMGRARGLIAIALLLTLFTTAAAVIDVPLRGGIGEHVYQPLTRSELDGTYRLAIGHLVLDLRDVSLSGRTTTVRATLGIGELEVLVPYDVTVDVHAHAGAGATTLFGHDSSGTSVDSDRSAPAVTGGDGVLKLDLRVGLGHVKVATSSVIRPGAEVPR